MSPLAPDETGARRAIVALGANLGDRHATLEAAVKEIAGSRGVRLVEMSPLFENVALKPEGRDPDAPEYVNAVIAVDTIWEPLELLALLAGIERLHGRVRAERWGDRTLDLDIVAMEGVEMQTERLTVPHPRAHERDFVLEPWLAIEPEAEIAGRGRVADLLAALTPDSGTMSTGEEPSP